MLDGDPNAALHACRFESPIARAVFVAATCVSWLSLRVSAIVESLPRPV